MSKVASTREIIEKLQNYEDRSGIGAVIEVSTFCNGDRTNQYEFIVANDSNYNRVVNNKDGHYKETTIKISSIDDDILFSQKTTYIFNCEFIDDDERFLSVLAYEKNEKNEKKFEVWIDMIEDPETMYYKCGNKPIDKAFEDILICYLEDNYPDYFSSEVLEFRAV